MSACSGQDAPEVSGAELKQRLVTAQGQLEVAQALDISLRTPSLPDGVTGLVSAQGQGTRAPAFKGTVTAATGSATLDADVIAVDGVVYAKTVLSPNFAKIDPASLKAPDPALLLSPDGGLTQLFAKTSDLAAGPQSRDGRDVLTTIEGKIAGPVIAEIFPTASSEKPFKIRYRLDDQDILRDATLTGQFYPAGDDVTYTVTIKALDKPVTITAP